MCPDCRDEGCLTCAKPAPELDPDPFEAIEADRVVPARCPCGECQQARAAVYRSRGEAFDARVTALRARPVPPAEAHPDGTGMEKTWKRSGPPVYRYPPRRPRQPPADDRPPLSAVDHRAFVEAKARAAEAAREAAYQSYREMEARARAANAARWAGEAAERAAGIAAAAKAERAASAERRAAEEAERRKEWAALSAKYAEQEARRRAAYEAAQDLEERRSRGLVPTWKISARDAPEKPERILNDNFPSEDTADVMAAFYQERHGWICRVHPAMVMPYFQEHDDKRIAEYHRRR